MPASEDIGREDKMLYRMDSTLLPDEVREALVNLHSAIVLHTDYLHVQVSFEDVQKECTPVVDVIVDKLKSFVPAVVTMLIILGHFSGQSVLS